MKRFQSLFPRGMLLLALIGSLLGVPLAIAGSPSGLSDWTSPDPPSIIKYLRAEINSKDAIRQQNALIDVIVLSRCETTCTVQFRSIPDKVLRVENETGVGTAIDLDTLVPDLLKAYRTGPADGNRLLALTALINIGNEKALEQLAAESSDRSSRQSKRVKETTQKTLAAFYLEKYPELTEKTMRSKNLSIEDVRRAEAVRVKLAKKKARAAGRNN